MGLMDHVMAYISILNVSNLRLQMFMLYAHNQTLRYLHIFTGLYAIYVYLAIYIHNTLTHSYLRVLYIQSNPSNVSF